jgi:hypothetical protein
VLIALAAAGLEALQRKTERDFPEATGGDGTPSIRERARRARAEAGSRLGTAINGLSGDNRDADDIRLDRLERLGELEQKGVLTDEEFRAEKQRILR